METHDYEPTCDNAAFVAMMLRVPVNEVFPFGAETAEDADDHFIWTIVAMLEKLNARLAEVDDSTEAFAEYRSRVVLCSDVLTGKISVPRLLWARMAERYGRGIYLSSAAHLRKEPRA